MYCLNCGAKIENENAKFCPKCGAVIENQSSSQKVVKPADVKNPKSYVESDDDYDDDYDEMDAYSKPRKSKVKFFIILLVIIIILLAIAAVFLKIKIAQKEANSSSNNNAAETTIDDSGTASGETEGTDTADTTDPDALIPGSNMDDAVLVPLGTKVFADIKPDGNVWFSFNTGDMPGATYAVTYVNTTEDSKNIHGWLLDKHGESLDEHDASYEGAKSNGVPQSLSRSDLQPNTTYFVRLNSSDDQKKIGCSIIIKNVDDKNTAYKTVGNLSETGGTANDTKNSGQVIAGTNQSNATMLTLDTKVTGIVRESGSVWFAFKTGDKAMAEYNVTYVNATENSANLHGCLYDEYGIILADHYRSYEGAKSDGAPQTLTRSDLEPNTIYYVHLESSDDNQRISYSVVVDSPEAVKVESPLVFETPFEINETQVQFVENKAKFIDENKAKEAVKPVADAILGAPGHSILIAGTTATAGTQKSSVTLSNKRAEAVKDLLVKTYNVPKDQIKTVGLGFELDPFARGEDIDANGNFVESEAKKNRRVVILDAEDPIAKQLLAG